MSDVRGNVLYSRETWEGEANSQEDWTVRFVLRLLDMLEKELGESGDRDWLVDAEERTRIKISEIRRVSKRVASGLYKLGLRPGDVLHTAYSSSLEFYWPVFGAWLVGARVSVSDPDLSREVVRTQLEVTGARLVVIAQSALSTFRSASSLLEDQLHLLVMDADPESDLPPGCSSLLSLLTDDGLSCPAPASLPEYDKEEVAVIFWTSGTTGVPKGVQHSQTLLHSSLNRTFLPSRSVSLQTNSMFHIPAFLNPLENGIRNRFTCYFLKDFSPERVLRSVFEYKPILYVGSVHQMKPYEDLSSLRCVMPLGGQCTERVGKDLFKLFPGLEKVYILYGMTEMYGVSKSLDLRSGCLGSLVVGCSAYIRDLETGERLGPGQAGELMVRSVRFMRGYLHQDRDNRQFFTEDGWAHTGDLVHYDSQGSLYFRDRVKEMMKVRASWVGPAELENCIQEIPGVGESCVWSTYNTSLCDDLIHAAVLPKPGFKLLKEDIVAHVREHLAPHKHITGDVLFVEQIPHNAQGKKLRKTLRERYIKGKL